MDADEVLERYFNDNERYADMVNGGLFNGEQLIGAKDLSDHDSKSRLAHDVRGKVKSKRKGRLLYRDLVKKAAFGVNFAVIGIENQSEVHYLMPLRVMGYDLAEYKRQAAKVTRKIKKQIGISSAEFLSGFGRVDKLKPCVTIVLFYGDEWDGSRDLHELLDFEEIPEKLKKYVANYPINLINIREFENTDVFKTDIKLVFDFIRCSDDKTKLRKLVEGNCAYKQMDEDAYDVVTLYSKANDLVGRKEYSREGGKINMCKALEDLKLEGREEGKESILRLISMMFGAGESPEAVKRISEDRDFLDEMRSKYLCAVE